MPDPTSLNAKTDEVFMFPSFDVMIIAVTQSFARKGKETPGEKKGPKLIDKASNGVPPSNHPENKSS